jgi:hypothetical protein
MSGAPPRRRRTPFVPPAFKPEKAGLGGTEDSFDSGGGTKPGEPIRVVEAVMSSHERMAPVFPATANTITSSAVNIFQR